jgi:hypothetical protein
MGLHLSSEAMATRQIERVVVRTWPSTQGKLAQVFTTITPLVPRFVVGGGGGMLSLGWVSLLAAPPET